GGGGRVGGGGVGGGDEGGGGDVGQDRGAALAREVGVDRRVVDRRRLCDAGDQRVLAEGQAVEAPAEVGARGSGDPITPVARCDLREVVGQDLLLVQNPLDLEGEDHALDLVVASVRPTQVRGFDQLLGDRGPALTEAPVG